MSWLKIIMENEPLEPENPIGSVGIGNLDLGMHDTTKVFIDKKENKANMLMFFISILAARNNLQKIVETLKLSKLKNKIMIIGGAEDKQKAADDLVTFFGRNIEEAVEIAKKAIDKQQFRDD